MAIKNKLKVSALTSILFSTSVFATYPTIDFSNLQQNVQQNIEQITSRVVEEAREKLKRQIEKKLSIKGNESDSAREITKIKADQDLATAVRNSEIEEQFTPNPDVCRDAAEREITDKAEKQAEQMVKDALGIPNDDECMIGEANPDNAKVVERKAKTFTSIAQQEMAVRADASETIEECKLYLRENAGDVNLNSGQNLAGASLCFDSSLISESDLSMFQSESAYKAALAQVNLMTEPLIRKKSIDSLEIRSPAGKKAILREFRKDLLMGLAQRTLIDYVEWRKPAGMDGNIETSEQTMASDMLSLELFNAKRYLDPEWMKKVANIHPEKTGVDGKDYSLSPSQLKREEVIIDGFLAHMAVLQYKSLLKQEVLQAAILSTEINEVK